jgi:hypothetical protein
VIAPGSRGWVNKYFELFKDEHLKRITEAPSGISNKEFLHLTLLESGIVFGYPIQLIYAKTWDTDPWTQQEKLKVLLFESLLFIYIQEKGAIGDNGEQFKNALLSFYKGHNSRQISDLFRLFIKESSDERLEKILLRRLDVKAHILEGNFWVHHMSNTFIYLDIVLFRQFLRRKKGDLSEYSELALTALSVISMSAFSSGSINPQEKLMFQHFLASANLKDKQRAKAELNFKKGMALADLGDLSLRGWFYSRFLLDISALTILANQTIQPDESPFYRELCALTDVPKKEIDSSIVLIENLLLEHNSKIEFLKSNNSYERMFSNLSHRWTKILARNKDKLALEIKESKELVHLVRKSAKEELTEEEKQIVKAQFLDIIKSMPALAIFMLPGGALLLPLILKILPDLIPSAFRDNELNDSKNPSETN